MVDFNNCAAGGHGQDRGGDGGKIKTLMGRTPDYLKSKFLSVLGSSNDLINGISNKLDISLSLSTSSDTEITEENTRLRERKSKRNNSRVTFNDDESIDDNIIDFESRKVKERRAHEEILSGRYRQPNFVTKVTSNEFNLIDINNSILASSISNNSNLSMEDSSRVSSSLNKDDIIEDVIDIVDDHPIVSDNNVLNPQSSQIISISPQPISDVVDADDSLRISPKDCNDSIINEDLANNSLESSELKLYIRSESENSVPSWASSISLDNVNDEIIVEFMKKFIEILFKDSSSITLSLKHEFGQMARSEGGRIWFSRLISSQRSKSKRVNETTYYSLIQYFAIILFECAESDDFVPAKILMNMCFTFYHEIDVPGCEPYREYLYTYLREQPIWHSLRFWNAAFFDALQCERSNKPVPKRRLTKKNSTENRQHKQHMGLDQVDSGYLTGQLDSLTIDNLGNNIDSDVQDNESKDCGGGLEGGDDDDNTSVEECNMEEWKEDQKFQQNISFGQLGTFTCNMHAFGLSRDLCTEFLRKQCIIANLNKDQEKMLRDNINRMYKETAKWRD